MNYLKLSVIIFGLLLLSCNQNNKSDKKIAEQKVSRLEQDKVEIRNLLRQMLKWSDSEKSFDVLPVIADNKDSFYVGFNFETHNENLEKLRQSDLFAKDFINNYDQIILTLDKRLKNGKYEPWYVGDLPTFDFANDVNPWCNCQDYLDWNKVEIQVVELNDSAGELKWNWGNLNEETDPSSNEFSYTFKVVKENSRWKIAYLQGFDLNEGVK